MTDDEAYALIYRFENSLLRLRGMPSVQCDDIGFIVADRCFRYRCNDYGSDGDQTMWHTEVSTEQWSFCYDEHSDGKGNLRMTKIVFSQNYSDALLHDLIWLELFG